MPRNNILRAILLTTLSLLATNAPAQSTTADASAAQRAAAEKKAFAAWAEAFFAEPHGKVAIPDAKTWFAEHFPADLAKPLSAEYLEQVKGIEGLPAFIEAAKQKGCDTVEVARHAKAIDIQANGLQNAALQRMTKPTALYTLRMTSSHGDASMTLWSFVRVGDKYYWLGKLSALNPTRGDMVADILCSMPLAQIEPLLKEKELITGSAVDYLREQGVLK